MKYFALVLLATLAHAAPRSGSSEPWPDVDDPCYQMDKTCEIRKRKTDIHGNCFVQEHYVLRGGGSEKCFNLQKLLNTSGPLG